MSGNSGIWLPHTEKHSEGSIVHGMRPGTHGIVLHDIEGTAESAISYFGSPQAGGLGAHLVVGPKGATQLCDLRAKCWHAVAANTYFIGIEHEGFASWTTEQWVNHGKELEFSANRAAWILHEFNLGAPVFKKNIFRHSDGGNNWGGHHDPGPGFPLHLWLNMAHHAYETHWGRN